MNYCYEITKTTKKRTFVYLEIREWTKKKLKLEARRLVNCVMQWQNICLPEITLKSNHRLVKLVGLEKRVANH